MFDCISTALISSLAAGLIAGLLLSFLFGPFSAMGRRADTRKGWEERKKKYGSAGKAWGSLYLQTSLIVFLIFAIVQVINCF